MKNLLLTLAVLIIGITAAAQDGRSIYNKYSGEEGVSAVYISPAMFRLIGKIPELKVNDNGVDISPLIRSLTGLYIISAENSKISGKLGEEASKFIGSKKYELLMEAKDDGEVVRMYTAGNDKIINSFVLIAAEKDETTFICFDGNVEREKFEETVAELVK